MSLTGPTIIAGRRALRIFLLQGVTALRGPSYAKAQGRIALTASNRASRRRQAAGSGQLSMTGMAKPMLARSARGTGALAVAGSAVLRRRRRGVGAGSLALTGNSGSGRRRAAKGTAACAATGQGAGYVRPGWATVGSSHDLDFKNNRAYQSGVGPTSLGSILTVTRSTAAYIDDSAGNWTSIPANTLRRSDKGALIEGSQTNSIRNNSMQGAVAGAPGTMPTNWAFSLGSTGLSSAVVGTGIESGIDYIDLRISGTVSNGGGVGVFFDAIAAVAGSQNQLWATSAFLRQTAGSLTGISSIQMGYDQYSSAPAYLATSQSAITIPTSGALGLNRLVASITVANASTASLRPRIGINVTSGAAVDITIRIGWPQFEQWSTTLSTAGGASSPIRTTTTASTRALDVVMLTLATNPAALTVAGVFRTSSFPVIFSGIALFGSGSDVIQMGRRGGAGVNLSVVPVVGGVQQTIVSYTGVGDNERFAFAGAVTIGDEAVSVNGSAPTTAAPAAIPSNLTTVQLGVGAGRPWFGYHERIAILPSRAANSNLQTLSSLANWGG